MSENIIVPQQSYKQGICLVAAVWRNQQPSKSPKTDDQHPHESTFTLYAYYPSQIEENSRLQITVICSSLTLLSNNNDNNNKPQNKYCDKTFNFAQNLKRAAPEKRFKSMGSILQSLDVATCDAEEE